MADVGDTLSVQYAGAGALKTDFTRLGARTFAGMLNDLKNTAERYVKNNFMDGYRQDAIDLVLGNYSVEGGQFGSRFKSQLKEFSEKSLPGCSIRRLSKIT